jgi:hypothetical protein
MEVVPHIVVPVEVLTRSSSRVSGLSVAVSDTLGVSLSKVRDRYFRGSDEVEVDRNMAEERDQLWEELQYEEGHRREDIEERCQEFRSYCEDTTF